MALVAGVYDGLSVTSPSTTESVVSTLNGSPATAQAVAVLNSGQTAPSPGQNVALTGGTAEYLTVKSVSGLNVTFTTNIVNASHTAMRLLATPNLMGTGIFTVAPATAQATVTLLAGSPIPVVGRSCTLIGGTPETLTVNTSSFPTVTFTANIANTGHTGMTWGIPALPTQIIVNSGSALIPGSPGGPRQQLHSTWMSAVLSGTGTFYVDWNGGIPQIITSTGTNLPAPAAGYIRLASFVQTAGVVSSITDLRGSGTYSQKLFNTTAQVAVSNKGYVRPYLFEPPGWDEVWRLAKANSATTPTWVSYIGESIMVGNFTSDMISSVYAARIRDTLIAAGYPMYAETWSVGFGRELASGLAYAGGGYAPWNGSGSLGANLSNLAATPFLAGIATNADLTTTWTFNTRNSCTGIDILYYDGASGTWKYSLDGAAATTVTSSNALWIKKVALTSLTAGVHSVNINTVSSQGAMQVCGASAYYGTTGIGHAFLGQNGGVLWASVERDQQVEYWMGRVSHNGTKTFGCPYQASLYVIELGSDDFALYTTVGVWELGFLLARLIRALRAGGDCSIIFVLPDAGDPLYSEVYGIQNPQFSVYWQFMDVLYRVAQQWGCAVLNVSTKWSEATGILTAGYAQAYYNGHFTDLGHLDVANTLSSIIV